MTCCAHCHTYIYIDIRNRFRQKGGKGEGGSERKREKNLSQKKEYTYIIIFLLTEACTNQTDYQDTGKNSINMLQPTQFLFSSEKYKEREKYFYV